MSDQEPQDVAESLDEDQLDSDRDLGYEGEEWSAPDRPQAVEDYGVTDREQAVDEPIDEHVRRETRDRPATRRESPAENDRVPPPAEETAVHVTDQP